MPERLQKILARHGLGSRREIERWIAEGRITVNLKPAKLGDHYEEGDRVAIDSKEITARLKIEVAAQVLMFHKAQGQPITHDDRTKRQPRDESSDELSGSDVAAVEEIFQPDDAEAVVDRLPVIRGSRWVPINPMHAGDSGLLLVTNDGNLSYGITRRKRWIPTAYMVRVLAPGPEQNEVRAIPELPLQVSYDNGRGLEEVEFTSVSPAGGEGSNLWYRVELPRADRRAAVRALFESHDLKVSRMTQVAFGNIELPRDLPRGRHRALTAEQIAALYERAQIKMPEPPVPKEFRADPRRARSVAPDRRRAAKPKPISERGDAKKVRSSYSDSDANPDKPIGRHHTKFGDKTGSKSVGKFSGKLADRRPPRRGTAASKKTPGKPSVGRSSFGERTPGAKTSGAKPFVAKTSGAKTAGKKRPFRDSRR